MKTIGAGRPRPCPRRAGWSQGSRDKGSRRFEGRFEGQVRGIGALTLAARTAASHRALLIDSAGAQKGRPPRSDGFPFGCGPRDRSPYPAHEITNKLTSALTTTSTRQPPPTPTTCGKLDTNTQHQNAQIRNMLHEYTIPASRPSSPPLRPTSKQPTQPSQQNKKIPNTPNLAETKPNQHFTTQSRSRPQQLHRDSRARHRARAAPPKPEPAPAKVEATGSRPASTPAIVLCQRTIELARRIGRLVPGRRTRGDCHRKALSCAIASVQDFTSL